MTDDDLDPRLHAACAAAREAGQLALRHFRERDRLEIEHKGRRDLVSRADREVEALIRTRVVAEFPDDGFFGEEGGGAEGGASGAERLWVVDPIDGTTNFLRGVPYWSVIIGYVVQGRTELGVTYDPVHDELFAARRGRGAERDGFRIRVSDPPDLRDAILALSYTFRLEPEPYQRLVAGCFRHGLDYRRLGSMGLMLCHVADGRLDGCVALRCNFWDAVAGLLLVREAGGVSSDFLADAAPDQPNRAFGCTPALAPVLQDLTGVRAA